MQKVCWPVTLRLRFERQRRVSKIEGQDGGEPEKCPQALGEEMIVTLPPKARWGTACNGCGLCCAIKLCVAGEMAFPGASAPCPALKIRGDGKSTYCQLVAIEIVAGLTPMLQEALGIGKGCSMRDADETIDAAMEDDAALANLRL